jgi:hypothetical protein
MGDAAEVDPGACASGAVVRQRGLRIARGMAGDERALLLDCWKELWVGTVRAHGPMLQAGAETATEAGGEELAWIIRAQ